MTSKHFDYLIIGAGIAGTSVAMRLAEFGSVAVLERETQPGYHATGRSAATFEPSYGPAKVRPMIVASEEFLSNPPEGFCEVPLLKPRGALTVFKAGEEADRDELIDIFASIVTDFEVLNFAASQARVPILDPEYTQSAIYTDAVMDLDVDALLQGYIRILKARGGTLVANAEVMEISRGNDWTVDTPAGKFSGTVLVNASGAWADVIGEMAGAKPVGLQPCRRSALLAKMPKQYDVSSWPLTAGYDPLFYFKPNAGVIMISPQDQTPSDPCDAWPEDMDIALAVHAFENVTTLKDIRPEHTWAGLRSFVSDEGMVAGYDGDVDGFFWLCGQGGFGIETSPTMSLIASELVRGKDFPQRIADFGLSANDLSPARLL